MSGQRRMYAGRLRTPEQIERRRAWKKQHGDNGRRIFYGADYQRMVATVELAQEINAACAAKAAELWAEFNAKQREERQALNERLDNMAPEEIIAAAAESSLFSFSPRWEAAS